MTTRRVLVAAVVMAVLPLTSSVVFAQDRTMRSDMQAHCEGAYDEKEGTNFGICHASAASGESKSPIGDVPETGSNE